MIAFVVGFLVFGLPVVAILDLTIVQAYPVMDIICLFISPAFAFLFYVWPHIVDKRNNERAKSNELEYSKTETFEYLTDITELLNEKPVNLGQPRQLTDNDRINDPAMLSEKEFMDKFKVWMWWFYLNGGQLGIRRQVW